MVQEEWIEQLVQSAVPDAHVHATDLNGGGDHWHVVVVSPSFAGLRPLQRQRPILAAAAPHFQTGLLHAFDLKCITPEELRAQHDGVVPVPFRPHGRGEGEHPGAWG
jgi:acid stress-induced BolA-like protein IbaG/YrbA